jgi:tRNA A-37 threonylcarbamoyl transferase component Bud32
MTLGQYVIIQPLSGDRSFLATDANGDRLVLKMLPPDCLLEGQLNPNIAERLRHVREIAMTDVAHLRGVERDAEKYFLVWDFVEGGPIDQYVMRSNQSAHDVMRLARELIHLIERFNATGLVHGQLHGNNVLMTPFGRLKLVDVSPLLFVDPSRDEQAVVKLIANIVQLRGEQHHPLGQALEMALRNPSPMQELSARLSAYEAGQPLQRPASPRIRIRRRTLLAALVAIMVGIGMGIAVTHEIRKLHPEPQGPPRSAE